MCGSTGRSYWEWREEWHFDPDDAPDAGEFQRVEVFLDAAWRTGIRNDCSIYQVWGRTRNGLMG